jgi:hypothetical protein
MPSTVEAVAVIIVALLPGALYLWAFERVVGRWGVGFADRFVRFVGVSAALHALGAPATYNVWFDYLQPGAHSGSSELPLWMWFVALGYVAVPTLLGYFVGWRFREGGKYVTAIVGATAAPTAWDDLFSRRPTGHVLVRLKSGQWVGGEYAEGSYAGGHPEPADLFLSVEAVVDQQSGNFVLDENSKPLRTGYGVLMRWADVEYLEIAKTEVGHG